MKDQYFADRRDFFKWDFLEDVLAGCPELRTFTNITMLTPPDDSRQGNLRAYEKGHRRAQLYEFLQECLEGGTQSVSQMRRYFGGRRFDYHPYRDSVQTPYEFDRREEYFADIPESKLQKALVFFDPDIGLNAGSLSWMRRSGMSKYLFDESLAVVSKKASDDSVIVVYQHLQRDRNSFWDDVEERCGRFRNVIGAKGAAFLTDRNIVFLATSRDPSIRLTVSNVVIAHAHKHGLDCGELAA